MVKKGQVAIVVAVMVIVLVILAIVFSGYLFSDKTTISVREDPRGGVFYVKDSSSDRDAAYTTGHSVYADNGCCDKDTFINYNRPAPEKRKVYMDNFHHVPTCCNDAHTFTRYHTDKPRVVSRPLDSTFHVRGCNY